MDLFKRSLAPIIEEAWAEVDQFAKEVFTTHLSARKFVDVVGPMGEDFSAVNVGRLTLPNNQSKNEVGYGIRKVLPIVETNIEFELDIWELDNIARGEKDADLDALEEAVIKSSAFEENAIYKGFEDGAIKGFSDSVIHSLDLPTDKPSYLKTVSQAINLLEEASIEGPYTLVLNNTLWENIVKESSGYPLERHLRELMNGRIIKSKFIDNGYVITERGGDFELTLGRDFSIGYRTHNENDGKVKLFITESFTFRIIEPKAFVKLG